MPVLQRCNIDPKDCLIQLLTVHFSHPHIRLHLHSIARCEMGKTVCIYIQEVSSVLEDWEAWQVQKALLHESAFHALPLLLSTRQPLRTYLCALLSSHSNYGMCEIWLHFDATCCKAQEQYALRVIAVSSIVLIFKIMKSEFPEYWSSLDLKQENKARAAVQSHRNHRSTCFAWSFTPRYTEMIQWTCTKGPIQTAPKSKQGYIHEEHVGFGTDRLLV